MLGAKCFSDSCVLYWSNSCYLDQYYGINTDILIDHWLSDARNKINVRKINTPLLLVNHMIVYRQELKFKYLKLSILNAT